MVLMSKATSEILLNMIVDKEKEYLVYRIETKSRRRDSSLIRPQHNHSEHQLTDTQTKYYPEEESNS